VLTNFVLNPKLASFHGFICSLTLWFLGLPNRIFCWNSARSVCRFKS